MTLPISNAAGTVKLVEQAQRLGRCPVVAEIVLGSYTLKPRAGNGGKVYESRDGYVLNALGLPNPGIDYAEAHADEFMGVTGGAIVSIAGFSVDEYAQLAAKAAWANGIEVNLGCPNVWNDGEQKRIGSFDPSFVWESLRAARDAAPLCSIRAKLSPVSDPALLAEVVAACEWADALVLSNTFPNGWLPGALDVAYGGVSGEAMKPIVLGQVRQATAISEHRVIAAGGVRCGADIADYEAAGAVGVQIASRFIDGGERPDVFTTLVADAMTVKEA